MTVQKLIELKERTDDVEIHEALDLAYAYLKLKKDLEQWRDLKIKLISKGTYKWLKKIKVTVELVQLDAIIHEIKEWKNGS